jgi:uncharacterized protein involved in exopolysaccharide biosynthesis
MVVDPSGTIGQGSVVAPPQSREEEINSVVEILQSPDLAGAVIERLGPDAILQGTVDLDALATSRARRAAELQRRRQHLEPHPTTTTATADRAAHLAGDAGGSVAELPAPSPEPPSTSSSEFLPTPEARAGEPPWWQRFSPIDTLSPEQQALKKLLKKLVIQAARKSNVVEIRYDGPTPESSQAVVAALVDLYLERHAAINRPQGTPEFFEIQVRDSERLLNDSEQRLRSLKDATGLASIDNQRRILVERIGRLEDQLLDARAQLTATNEEIAVLRDQLSATSPTLVGESLTGFPDGMRQQLFALQIREQELLTKYTEEMWQVREVREQLKNARAALEQAESARTQVKTVVNPNFAQLELRLNEKRATAVALAERVRVLAGQVESSEGELAALNEGELQLKQLEREVDMHQVSYRRYAENLQQARVDELLGLERISNISVAQPASYDSRPVEPRKTYAAAGVLGASLFGGLALALIFDQLRPVETRPPKGPNDDSPPGRRRRRRRRPTVSAGDRSLQDDDQDAPPPRRPAPTVVLGPGVPLRSGALRAR